ncbi:MAG: Hpt domain-containing protein [Lachnospiraceae bacterium]|nr:Hpt domain-containing protein [Lachnospiraceae bacterium]
MRLENLKNRGFDVDSAMELCIGSEEIYQEILDAALDEGKKKLPLMKECVEKEDYERYCIEVHGLKNAAKQIGAMELSELALEQEKAAKAGSYDVVKENYEAMLAAYQKIIDALEEFLKEES